MIDSILAIEFEDPADEHRIQSILFLTASTGSTSTQNTIAAYFDSPSDRDAAEELLREFELRALDRERVDWIEKYQQSLEPLFIGERFVVVPDPSLLRPNADLNIIPEVIVPLLGDVVPRLAPDARLILSGILIVKRGDVVAAAHTHARTHARRRA